MDLSHRRRGIGAYDGKLETAFEDKGLSRQIGLLHKLIKSDLDSCGSMEVHIARVCKDSRKGVTFCTVLSTSGKGDANDCIFGDVCAYDKQQATFGQH